MWLAGSSSCGLDRGATLQDSSARETTSRILGGFIGYLRGWLVRRWRGPSSHSRAGPSSHLLSGSYDGDVALLIAICASAPRASSICPLRPAGTHRPAPAYTSSASDTLSTAGS